MAIAEQRNYIPTVADAIGRDPDTGNVLFIAQSLISSMFTISMDELEVRGGENNQLLYKLQSATL